MKFVICDGIFARRPDAKLTVDEEVLPVVGYRLPVLYYSCGTNDEKKNYRNRMFLAYSSVHIFM